MLPKERLESVCKAKVTEFRATGGGDISASGIAQFDNGLSVFVKWSDSAPAGIYAAEATGLDELRQVLPFHIPQVRYRSDPDADDPEFIVLEALSPASPTAAREEQLGRLLATIHNRTSAKYGFQQNNFIGRLPQCNAQESEWGKFFWNHRLLAQAELGSRSWCTGERFSALQALEGTIVRELDDAATAPALLHGDLWSGNVLWSDKGPMFIDPAVYYGDPEADIAFTELFGGFGQRCYSAYYEIIPQRTGFSRRRTILNLYHLMTHANMFGSSYVREFDSALRKLG